MTTPNEQKSPEPKSPEPILGLDRIPPEKLPGRVWLVLTVVYDLQYEILLFPVRAFRTESAAEQYLLRCKQGESDTVDNRLEKNPACVVLGARIVPMSLHKNPVLAEAACNMLMEKFRKIEQQYRQDREELVEALAAWSAFRSDLDQNSGEEDSENEH